MRIKIEKSGIRALGIAESFRGDKGTSLLAGVVMRSDLIIDGFSFGSSTIQGNDATEAIIGMHNILGRNDINVIMVNGAIISLYNIIDVDRVNEITSTPVICVTFKESRSLTSNIMRRFGKEAGQKLELYRKLGKREKIQLKTGYRVFLRTAGIDIKMSTKVLDKFTLQGAVPEPLRVARLLAKAGFSFLKT